MVHGATLTGKSWETTPDGRMGWDEYFVRKGHPVYVPDQVGRGRSGFNQAVFNNVRAGSAPATSLPALAAIQRRGRLAELPLRPESLAQPYPDSQFPVTAVDELSKQGVPDVSFGGVPTPNPTLKALADLAGQLNGAVLMGHSQSGSFPLAAALLNPAATKGLVLVEPGSCPANYTDEQIATLAKVPILVVFGDHRDTPTGIPALPSWQARFEGCQALHRPPQGGRRSGRDAQPGRDRHPRQQPHDHAGQEPPADRRSDPEVDRRARQQAGGSEEMKNAAILAGGLLLALAVVRPFALQPAPTRLALELQDYAALPITADNTNTNTRAQLARVNYLRDEPGGRRFFVNDLNGPLYILDKQTKAFTTYLDFNGRGGRPGLFPKFTFELNFATGLTSFIFDPDYAKNGVFYTLHMEDPATDAAAAPKAGVVAGLDLTGYTTTPAISTPTVGGRIDREVVLIEWRIAIRRTPRSRARRGS